MDPSQPAHIKDPARALAFLLAGDAHVTFRSHKTGTHFTYHVTRADRRPGDTQDPPWFVAVLTGPDHYEYLGCIFGGKVYSHGRRSSISFTAYSAQAFAWVWKRLSAGRVPDTCDVYHEGRCGRCGRPLTTPESIESGIGPVCAKKAEVA